MQQFIIDPRQQNLGRVDKRLDENLYLSEEYLDPWNWFISWYEMKPLPSMIAILEKTFFPKMASSVECLVKIPIQIMKRFNDGIVDGVHYYHHQ